MELLKEKLKNKKYQAAKTETNWYRELGKEMTAYFGKNCFWLPYRYEQWKLREKFRIAQQEEKNFQYFIGMLNK